MEFNLLSLFGVSVALMIMFFFMYFIIRAAKRYHDAVSNIWRITAGSIVAGGGFGIIFGFCLWCVLPTHYYITSLQGDGHYTRYVLDSEFKNEYGRSFVINLSDEPCYLCAMGYGNKSLDDVEDVITPILSGYIFETKHNIDKWFEPFPEQIRTEEKGEIKWHILSESQAKKEFE